MSNFDILAWFALNWKLSFSLPNQVRELSPFHWDSRVSQLREEDIGWVVRPEDPLRSGYPIGCFRSRGDIGKRSPAALASERYTYDRAIALYRQLMNDVMHNHPVI